ncbi:MAG TPA: hypothetical protein DEP69_05570 [Acidimicrobiaceae bacterium]|nr:hypothetical protein [Acidimicrobiaceae bacterium]
MGDTSGNGMMSRPAPRSARQATAPAPTRFGTRDRRR